MNTAVLPASAEAAAHRVRPSARRFYIGIAVLMTAMVVVGFWPSYFGPFLGGVYERPWMFHLHGAVFLGWMGLLIAQVVLVSIGRTRMHRKIGAFGIAYGLLVLTVGLAMSFYAPVFHIRAGEWTVDRAAAFLLLPLGDMVVFAGFFGAAIIYRRTPEIHKRLIVLATVALVFAGVARRVPFAPPWTFLLIWFAPLLAAMAYDWRTRRRVHPLYLMGTAILTVAYCRVFFMESQFWLGIGGTLLAPLV